MTDAAIPIGMSPPAAQRSDGSARAWLIVGATLGNLISVTQTVNVTLGVLLVPISEDFGWSRTQVSGAFAALSLASAAMFPVAGRLADRLGTRRVLVAGFLLMGLAIVALSRAPASPGLFYAMFALVGGVSVLASNMLLCKLISEWFETRRGFWMGLTGGVGNGLGAILMPILAASLMAWLGWRGAFAGVGLIVLLIGVPMALFMLRSPPARIAGHDAEEELTGVPFGQAMRSPLFWLVFSTVPVGGGALTAVFANTVPMLESRGFGIEAATAVTTVFALICVLWEPLVGWLLDRSARPRLVAPFYAAAVCGLVLLSQASSLPLLMLGGVLTGVGLGSEFSVMPFLLSRYFGLKAMGAISGIAFAGTLVSTALTPVLLNACYDLAGSYTPGLAVVGALLVYTCAVFVVLPAYAAD